MRADEFARNGTFVKICGITNEDDALLAVAMGADALGFNFVSTSVRLISPMRAADIVKRLPTDIATIGIFRDEAPERVVEICQRVGLTGAQLNGHETVEQCRYVSSRVGLTIQVFAAGSAAVESAKHFPVDVIMVDGANSGSGKVFDWSLVDAVPDGKRLLLAGGLGPDNVASAIEAVEPWGVDVATGVEKAPGVKDPTKLRTFITNARAAGEALAKRQNARRGTRSGDAPYDWQEEL